MVVVVTGGTSGMGLSAAKSLVAAGAAGLVIVGRDPERGATALKVLEAEAAGAGTVRTDIGFVAANVATWAGAREAIRACVGRHGRIDALVNSAGAHGIPRLFHHCDETYVEQVISGLLYPNLLTTRAALEHMEPQRQGAVVCIASDAGKFATPGEAVIGAAYGGTVMFCRALAMEAKRYGVRVNVITPSVVINTRAYDAAMNDPFASKLFGAATKRASLGIVEPDELGPLVVFLVGPGAAKVTGQAISINGGISAS